MLTINNTVIKREQSTKFLGILVDENLTWKSHIHYLENKISKNIGLLYKAKFLLDRQSLKNIYFSFIHSYINYANIAWASTNQIKLKKLLKYQKHASRIIYNRERTTHARPLMKSLKALNIYQTNILQNLLLTYKSKNGIAPTIFQSKFKSIEHKYPTRQTSQKFYLPKASIKTSNFRISYRGPYIRNNIPSEENKNVTSLQAFKNKIKHELLNNDNELYYF